MPSWVNILWLACSGARQVFVFLFYIVIMLASLSTKEGRRVHVPHLSLYSKSRTLSPFLKKGLCFSSFFVGDCIKNHSAKAKPLTRTAWASELSWQSSYLQAHERRLRSSFSTSLLPMSRLLERWEISLEVSGKNEKPLHISHWIFSAGVAPGPWVLVIAKCCTRDLKFLRLLGLTFLSSGSPKATKSALFCWFFQSFDDCGAANWMNILRRHSF